MRCLVVSDTHGRQGNLEKVIQKVGHIDMLIHCGDVEGFEEHIRGLVDCEVHMVRGNCDTFSDLPREDVFSVGKYTIFLTHGHHYKVNYGTEDLKNAAMERWADIAIYGHTHIPMVDQSELVMAINPGSLTQPRQDGHQPSFLIMETDRFGEIHFALNYL